jgi:hypothetical protein
MRVCVCVRMCAGVCLRACSLTYVILFATSLSPPYFWTLTHKWQDFRKKVTEHEMFVLTFSTTFIWNIAHSKIIQRDIAINVKTSSCKVPVILVGFYWNLNFINKFSEKGLNIKFHQNSSSGSTVVPCGQTDGHNEANSRFSQFCERA